MRKPPTSPVLTRRTFLGASGALIACHDAKPPIPPPPPTVATLPQVETIESVLLKAIDAAKQAGATYADARIVRRRHELVATREDHVTAIDSSESYGIGVRVIAFGAWGFAASSVVSTDRAVAAAKRAVAIAKADSGVQKRPIELVACLSVKATYETPMTKNPFDVSLGDKAELLRSIWREAVKVPGVSFGSGSCEAFDEEKTFASTDGSVIKQRIMRVGADFTITATDKKTGQFETRSHELPPMQAGWEHVAASSLLADARSLGEDAVKKLKSPSVTPGKKDLVLAPSHLWLTIHESVGHPTELDRALGYEANLAGTSFATVDKLGKLDYAAPFITFYADKTTTGGLATSAYDDDGVKTQRWDLVKKGIFVGYQTTRDQAKWINESESRGTSYADSFKSVAFQRMPNVSLMPGDKKQSIDDLIAATDDGILITGDGSWSIDQQRYNFQFGGQMFYEIKKGKVTQTLKDVAYQSNTLEFWHSCDMIGDASSWKLNGTLYDGKGEPGQSNPVSHGCPPARFRKVNVLNTSRRKS